MGGLRRVGVRAAPAIVGRVGQVRRVGRVGGRAERAFVGCLLDVCSLLIVRLSFAHPSLNVR